MDMSMGMNPKRAEGCCSAISPCPHQQRDPSTICDICQKAAALASRTAQAAPGGGIEIVWIQNLISFVEGKFPRDDEWWKAIFIERLRSLTPASGGVVLDSPELKEQRDWQRACIVLESQLREQQDRANRLQAKLDVLASAPTPDTEAGEVERALRPFAEIASDPGLADHPDNYAPRPARGKPNMGHYRTAREVLRSMGVEI